MVEIYIKELMTAAVFSISPETMLSDAIKTMLENRYSCLIVTERDYPVGIITERDIVRLMSEFFSKRPECPILVREVMSVPVATVTENTTLFEALVISTAQKIRHLPVVDGVGRLRGLVTQSDLAKANFHLIEKQREVIEREIDCKTCELQQANEQLKALSMVDALMGIGNRRAMEVDLDHTHALALRYQRTYAVALFDVDYFKSYNDCCGHLAGDDALKTIAEYLQTCIRKSDRLYRYGGEEILLLLPETSPHGAMTLIDRIVEGLSELRLPHPASPLNILTISCGVACQAHEPPHASWKNVLQLADYALYSAKKAGRNQAILADEVVGK